MIQAIDNKIIVAELKRHKTAGGIVIPSTVVEPQAYGKVISIGDGVPMWEDKEKTNVKIGDVVVYHKMGGQAISIKNKIFCCVPFPEIYGILTDEDTLQELQEIEITPEDEVVGKQAQQAPSLIQRV